MRDVRDLFKMIGCNSAIVKMHRLGRPGGTKVRSLKVEFHSASDRNQSLSASRNLKNDTSTSKIAFRKWMEQTELAELKSLRLKCTELNSKATPLSDGKLPYIVRSGRLMKKSDDGKFMRVPADSDKTVKPAQAHASKSPGQHAKNAVGGSHVTPSSLS